VCSELCDGKLAGRKVTQVRRWRDREKQFVVEHQCRPMSPSTVRQLNAILSGAFQMAIRWEWINRNPARQAKLPLVVPSEPEPPEPEEVGRLLDQAWQTNPDLAVYLWLAVISGSRRGELCGWRWNRFDLDEDDPSATVALSYAVVGGKCYEKETRTHAIRRMAIDEVTRELLLEHRGRQVEAAGPQLAYERASPFMVSWVADPQGGQSLPEWVDNVDWYARDMDEIRVMLYAARALMYDRSPAAG
jgi:integrase